MHAGGRFPRIGCRVNTSARIVVLGALVFSLVLMLAGPVAAQEPTPTPETWPTPIANGDYVVYQTVTYGEQGIMIALLFVGGVTLLSLIVHLVERWYE